MLAVRIQDCQNWPLKDLPEVRQAHRVSQLMEAKRQSIDDVQIGRRR